MTPSDLRALVEKALANAPGAHWQGIACAELFDRADLLIAAWELAEAARLLEDGMTMGRTPPGGPEVWYPAMEDAIRFRAALARFRAAREAKP